MTENRYLTNLLTGDIIDTVTNEFIKGSGIARRLNELAEENEQSKMMIATLRNIVLENENLEKENKTLKEEKETYKTLYEEMSYYFRDGITLRDLDHKDFHTLQRLAKGLVD